MLSACYRRKQPAQLIVSAAGETKLLGELTGSKPAVPAQRATATASKQAVLRNQEEFAPSFSLNAHAGSLGSTAEVVSELPKVPLFQVQ